MNQDEDLPKEESIESEKKLKALEDYKSGEKVEYRKNKDRPWVKGRVLNYFESDPGGWVGGPHVTVSHYRDRINLTSISDPENIRDSDWTRPMDQKNRDIYK